MPEPVTPPPGPAGGWLDEEDLDLWKAVVLLLLELPGSLDGQLRRDSGLTLFEYLVLSSLSMAVDGSSAMSELARLANGSLSRLSNVVKKFEQRGWVVRHPAAHDGRVTVAEITATGRQLVEAAAPGHVDAVRRHVVDPLTAHQRRVVIAAVERIGRTLDCTGTSGPVDTPPAAC